MDLTISTLTLESFLLVFVRIATFFTAAPVFSHRAVNRRLRLLIAACVAITMYTAMDTKLPEYETVLGYTGLLLKEALVGLSIGFVASLAMSILIMAGEFIDREIGFTMAQTFDPGMNANVTITAELYDKVIYLCILITNLHHFILRALADSFALVPMGRINFDLGMLYTQVVGFITQYFSIGFRIAMPVFLAAIMINVVLGILAKSSPQMNMFAIGMQLKVFAGLTVLSICVMFIPNIANYLMERMYDMVTSVLGGM